MFQLFGLGQFCQTWAGLSSKMFTAVSHHGQRLAAAENERLAIKSISDWPNKRLMRGGKTSAAVMSRLFKHLHHQLRAPIDVTDSRLNGQMARALYGSTAIFASYIMLEHEPDGWKVLTLLGTGLP